MQQRPTLGTAAATSPDTQYLTFTLGSEEYGIDILRVQEIKGHTAITPIPNAPAFVKGVMNLRGIVLPVIGLRETFDMPSIQYDKFSVIIVINVGARAVGMLVDSVSDVLNLKLTDINLAPELGGRIDMSFIQGMARVGDKFIVILAIDKLVAGVDMKTASGPSTAGELAGASEEKSAA